MLEFIIVVYAALSFLTLMLGIMTGIRPLLSLSLGIFWPISLVYVFIVTLQNKRPFSEISETTIFDDTVVYDGEIE